MKNKNLVIFCTILLVLTLGINLVSSFAVSSKYWEENPLTIYPGETKDFFLVLQNLAGDSDVSVQGFVTEGNDIVKFIDESPNYDVPLGSKIQVNLRAEVPEDSLISDLYTVRIEFKTVKNSESGDFSFGAGVEREIPILVIAPEKTVRNFSDYQWIVYIMIILLLALILFFVVKRIKKEKQKP